MSHYSTVECEWQDLECLLTALQEVKNPRTGQSWVKGAFEVNKTAQHLFGFHGDQRKETAEIVIRRNQVGRASNDIGFKKQANGYSAIVSDFDKQWYGQGWLDQIGQRYAVNLAKKNAPLGYSIQENQLDNGHVQLLFVRNY